MFFLNIILVQRLQLVLFAKSGTCNPHMFATPIMCENVVKSHFFDVVYMEN